MSSGNVQREGERSDARIRAFLMPYILRVEFGIWLANTAWEVSDEGVWFGLLRIFEDRLVDWLVLHGTNICNNMSEGTPTSSFIGEVKCYKQNDCSTFHQYH